MRVLMEGGEMKTVAMMALAFCATLFFGYLVGAFVAGNFDSSTWDAGSKAILAIFSIICAAAASFYVEEIAK